MQQESLLLRFLLEDPSNIIFLLRLVNFDFHLQEMSFIKPCINQTIFCKEEWRVFFRSFYALLKYLFVIK
jgi:hypothetical protein